MARPAPARFTVVRSGAVENPIEHKKHRPGNAPRSNDPNAPGNHDRAISDHSPDRRRLHTANQSRDSAI